MMFCKSRRVVTIKILTFYRQNCIKAINNICKCMEPYVLCYHMRIFENHDRKNQHFFLSLKSIDITFSCVLALTQ